MPEDYQFPESLLLLIESRRKVWNEVRTLEDAASRLRQVSEALDDVLLKAYADAKVPLDRCDHPVIGQSDCGPEYPSMCLYCKMSLPYNG